MKHFHLNTEFNGHFSYFILVGCVLRKRDGVNLLKKENKRGLLNKSETRVTFLFLTDSRINKNFLGFFSSQL
jgi:hypothetical protein